MRYVDARSALIIAPVGRLGLIIIYIGNPAGFGWSASRPRPPKGEVTLSFGISRYCRVRYRMVIWIGEAVCPCFGIHYYRHSPCFGIVHRKATKSYRISVLAPINSERGKLVTTKEIISHSHVSFTGTQYRSLERLVVSPFGGASTRKSYGTTR